MSSPTNSTSPLPPLPAKGSRQGDPFPAPKKGSLPPGALIVLILGVTLGAILVLIGVGVFVIFYKRKKRKQVADTLEDDALPLHRLNQITPRPSDDNHLTLLPKPSSPSTNASIGTEKLLQSSSHRLSPGFPLGTFSYEELAIATDGFSSSNLLGQGGFGYVHKGVLADGKVVAIKQLKAGSRQGEREFSAEVDIISRVHHRHLVSLVGYCIAGARSILVYEFMPNNNLQFHLHGKGRASLDWSTRLRIALGAAKGLAYLHEDCYPKIMHRDIKVANILLDYKFDAKVADFGLARCFQDTDTHVSTRVVGTFGYLAPEYACTGNLTDKSDVFSFGVVLLELITGRRPVDRTKSCLVESLVDWARPLLKQCLEDGDYDPLIDPQLHNVFDSIEMTRMIYCAAACVRQLARLRPKMSQIIRALEGNLSLDELSEEITPGFSMVDVSSGSCDQNSTRYEEEFEKYETMVLENREHDKVEHSGTSSEHDQHHSIMSTERQQSTQAKNPNREDKNIEGSIKTGDSLTMVP